MSAPQMRMLPLSASQKRGMRRTAVVLPAPLPPTSAVRLPAGAVKLMSVRAFRCARGSGS